MFKDQEDKILLGNSIQIPEVDVDENRDDEMDPIAALKGYWQSILLDNIGKDVFKQNYLNVRIDIQTHCSLDEQRRLCYAILDRISEVYDFEFGNELSLNNFNEINEVYKFLEFLEYDNEDFICNIWLFLGDSFLEKKINIDNIIKEIEDQVDQGDYSQIISIFLRTNNKSSLYDWFIKKSDDISTLIKLKILEEKEKRNG